MGCCLIPPLEPRLALEIPIEENRGHKAEHKGYGEAPNPVLHAVGKVHTEQTGDEGGEHQDNADAGEHLHHLRHVVVDDVSVGFHRRFQDVGIDVRGLARPYIVTEL